MAKRSELEDGALTLPQAPKCASRSEARTESRRRRPLHCLSPGRSAASGWLGGHLCKTLQPEVTALRASTHQPGVFLFLPHFHPSVDVVLGSWPLFCLPGLVAHREQLGEPVVRFRQRLEARSESRTWALGATW